MAKSEISKLRTAINKEERHDRRNRKRELNKRNRRTSSTNGGKSGFKKTTHKFESLT